MKNRKSPRKKWYDYTSSGAYFVTINTKNRKPFFWRIIKSDDPKKEQYMRLNSLWKCCKQKIEQINTRKNVTINEWVIMPDHIHMIVILAEWDINRNDKKSTIINNNPMNLSLNNNPMNLSLIGPGRDNQNQTEFSNQTQDGLTNRPYDWPTLWNIIKLFKWNVSKYAKQNNISFARQSRYHDHIIRNHNEYRRIQWYIINNPRHRKGLIKTD